MKKIMLSVLSIICMHSVFAQEAKLDNMSNMINMDMSYKIDIKRNVDGSETHYVGHFVEGRVTYFNEMNNLTYIAQNKCENNKPCEAIKGTENYGVAYVVDMTKPNNKKDDVVVFLQINEKMLKNQRKVCETSDKCVDMFDISMINFKETLKMKENQPKTLHYNNVSYTITVNKE